MKEYLCWTCQARMEMVPVDGLRRLVCPACGPKPMPPPKCYVCGEELNQLATDGAFRYTCPRCGDRLASLWSRG